MPAAVDWDDAYANMPYIPDGASYPARWAAEAKAFRQRAAWRSVDYGPAEREAFDLFVPGAEAQGLLVFVHGGYWRAFDRRMWSHLAAGALAHGWAVAMPSYTLAPEARIAAITAQVARAFDRAADEVPGPIRLAGHSAGGHLVARMLMADVPLRAAERLVGCVPISPVADLRPLLRTAINDDLRLDEAEAEAESPALGRPRRAVPTTVWVGADERPAFLDQARWLSDAWDMPCVVEPGRHHFDVIAGMTAPGSPLTRTILGLAA